MREKRAVRLASPSVGMVSNLCACTGTKPYS